MNWGTGIVISFILFIGMIFLFVFLGGREPSDLVTEDYYAQELQYEQRIEAIRNTSAIEDSINILRENDGLIIVFPTSAINGIEDGVVDFYRPSEADDDVAFTLQPGQSGKQFFPYSELKKGRYVIKISWKKNGLDYYWEKGIII
jgi:nitrogen fixation protein FixH